MIMEGKLHQNRRVGKKKKINNHQEVIGPRKDSIPNIMIKASPRTTTQFLRESPGQTRTIRQRCQERCLQQKKKP
jgi:hypothetical protein